MYRQSLLLAFVALLLGGCATYDYDYYEPYPRRYTEVRPYPVYGGPAVYGSNYEYRRYSGAPRYYQPAPRYDARHYHSDNRSYQNRSYNRYDDNRHYDRRRYDPPRYYRGNDGDIHQYQQLRGHDRPRYVAPPKNAQKHTGGYRQPSYRQDMHSAPPGGYRGGPRY